MWYFVEEQYYYIPAKCGSTSFEKSVGRDKRVKKPDSPHKRNIAIRCPVERFISFWRFCQVEHWKYHRIGSIYEFSLYGCTPDFLMDVIERNPHIDKHWIRQTGSMKKGDNAIAFDKVLETMGREPIHENKSFTAKPLNVPVKRILNHYRKDNKIFNLTILSSVV